MSTATTSLQTQTADLAASSGTGGLWLNNLGALTINAVGTVIGLSAGGSLVVIASGTFLADQDVVATGLASLTSTAGDITVPAATLVQSTGGSVTLNAAGNVTLAPLSTVSANTTVTILGGSSSYSTITLAGTLKAVSAKVATDSPSDGIVVDVVLLPAGVPLTVAGGNSNNAINITENPGADLWTISSTQVLTQLAGSPVTINYAAIETMAIYGNNDNDTFNVQSTSATTTIDSGDGNNTLNLYASVQNGSTVLNAPVFFVGGTGNNAVNVFGTGHSDTIVLANESVQSGSDVAALVGAGLQLQYSNPVGTITPALNFTLNTNTNGGNSSSSVYVLGTVFTTTIKTGAGSNSIYLGGTSSTLQVPVAGGIATFTKFETLADGTTQVTAINGINETIKSGFDQAIAIDGAAGTNFLSIDASGDANTLFPVLTATTISAIGENEPVPGTPSIHFTGISSMAIDLGSGGMLRP